MNLGVVSSFALVSVSPLATDVQVGDICTLSTEHLYSTGAVSPGSVCQLGIGDTFLVSIASVASPMTGPLEEP